MALALGTRSASVKFCAKEATSTPEPVPKAVMSFCALVRLFAAMLAAVTRAAGTAEDALVDVLGGTDVAMGQL
jgi:hypothetical protein